MNYWLVKFAPFRYSWNDTLKNGRFEIYSVRSPQARNYLRQMERNDRVLFYHSQKGNEVMGIMKVIEAAHQDPTTVDEQWLSVTFDPVESFKKPVSLATIKQHTSLENIGLIKQPRLSVMPLTKHQFEIIVANSKLKE